MTAVFMGAISFLVVSSIRIHFYSSNVNLRMWRVFRLYRTLLRHTCIGFASICFLLLSAYTFLLSAQRAPTPHQNPPKPSREKEKVLQSCHDKRAALKTVHSVIQAGSINFQRYFFPLDGGGGVLINSIIHFLLTLFFIFSTLATANSNSKLGNTTE